MFYQTAAESNGVSVFAEQLKIERNEQIMWQQSYIECCEQMGQWKALEELGKHVDDYNLLGRVYSHSLMWRELKETILPFALVSFLSLGHNIIPSFAPICRKAPALLGRDDICGLEMP